MIVGRMNHIVWISKYLYQLNDLVSSSLVCFVKGNLWHHQFLNTSSCFYCLILYFSCTFDGAMKVSGNPNQEQLFSSNIFHYQFQVSKSYSTFHDVCDFIFKIGLAYDSLFLINHSHCQSQIWVPKFVRFSNL